jgi:hypothetical protein
MMAANPITRIEKSAGMPLAIKDSRKYVIKGDIVMLAEAVVVASNILEAGPTACRADIDDEVLDCLCLGDGVTVTVTVPAMLLRMCLVGGANESTPTANREARNKRRIFIVKAT